MAASLAGKIAFVTGGASGIGRAIAVQLGARGAAVFVGDIDGRASDATAQEIRAQGAVAHSLLLDVADSASVASARDAIGAAGGLDIAVNNAGIAGPRGGFEALTEGDFDNVIAINLRGVFLSMQAEIGLMRTRGGSIINMSSALGMIGNANAPAYVAAKHGVIGLTRSAAIELSASGIRVNAVCPGVIDTPLMQRAGVTADARANLVAHHPIGRLGTPDEVTDAVCWLASSEASFVTGATVAVDGGWTAT